MKIPTRAEVDKNTTWNLKDLFENDEAFYTQLDKTVDNVNSFNNKYKDNINDSDIAVALLKEYENLQIEITRLATYASLYTSEDQSNQESMQRSGTLQMRLNNVFPKLNFVNQQLKQLDESTLNEIKAKDSNYTKTIDLLLREKPHTLTAEIEDALSEFNSTLNAPYGIYNMHKLVDMKFDSVKVAGKEIPMTFGFFEDDLAFDNNQEIRHQAFDKFYGRLKESENTIASIYTSHVLKEKAMAKLKGFDNTIDYLLFDQQVSRDMYDRQIDLIMEHLAPAMRKFAKLIQKVHNLDEMTYKDLHLVIDPEYEPDITIEQAKEQLLEGLSVLGDDYLTMVNKAFDERWIDFPFNLGKSTGAFCSSPYGVHPYILISWTHKMRELFVLAHELGHAGHFYLAGQHQNLLNTRASLYFIEAPSTMNELLVANHLKKTATEPRLKRWILSTLVSRTYYHNFVTHLLEAAFQREVYKTIDNDKPLSASVLNDLYQQVLEDFWGEDVVISENANLTWMRQPHYYMGLYPYTYSAGLTIATVASEKILKEELAIEDYKEVLKAGGSKDPLQLAAMLDIDLSSEKPLMETIKYISDMIDEIADLTDIIK